ncbi:MAG: ATP-binding protein, partial [Bryobacteraceae bacterium]|nr:ATP-binding protein [Bryobacteraceae bacterium]
LARMQAGKLSIRREPFDLDALIRQIAALLKPLADSKSLPVFVRYPEGAPRRFTGDADRIGQILLNLLGNAIKFTSSGHVLIAVEVREEGGDRASVRVSVQDTGPGVPEQKQKELFQSFVRLEQPGQPRPPGAGLGLAISKNLVELMGGSIGVNSRPGTGSTFWFELPLPLAPPAPHAAPPSPTASATPLRLTPPLRILLAEDNPVNQQVARRMLERFGCQVDIAAHGEEALRLHERARYDLILLDCDMPHRDGYETAREIRRREQPPNRTPIVALSASTPAEELPRCSAAGMDDFLAKPLRTEDLEALLRRWSHQLAAPRL